MKFDENYLTSPFYEPKEDPAPVIQVGSTCFNVEEYYLEDIFGFLNLDEDIGNRVSSFFNE